MEIRHISYSDILDSANAGELLKEYSEECAIPEIGATNPQREMYARMESSGLMHSFGVFEGDHLVGFATLLVFVLPHYGKLIANVESMFVMRSHRSNGSGKRLMQELEAWAHDKKCEVLLYNARTGSRLERLLSASAPNYERTNSVFLRRVS